MNENTDSMEQKAKNILIIEDEEDVRNALKEGLQRNGLSCFTAGNGLEGLALSKEKKPDLIILDLGLPGLSGIEVCKEIRKDETICSIPIIMFTAKDSDVDRVIGKVVGANRYLPKPCRLSTLLEEIKHLIGD